MEKCGRPPLPPSKDPKVQAKREKARVPESEKKGKCGRKPLPPSDDPKVQARREKSRAAAQKKREGVKQVKAETKASTTINQAIKMKIARKAMAAAKAAKAPPPPAAKVDDNRLHNLPEDLQKKIMGMANDKWTSNTFVMCDEALFHLMLGYELGVNKKIHHKRNKVEGWYDEVYLPNWKDNYITNFMKEHLPDEYAKIRSKTPKKENDSDVAWNGAKLYVKWIDEDNATPELFKEMMHRKDMRHELTLQELKNQNLRKDTYIALRESERHRYKGTIQKSKKKGVVVKEWLWRGAIMYGMKLTDKEGNFKDDVVLMFDVADTGYHTGDPDRRLAMSYFTDGKYHLDRAKKGVKSENIGYKLK